MGSITARIKTIGHVGPLVLKLEIFGQEKDLETFVADNKDVGGDCYTWYFDNQKRMSLVPKKVFNINLLSEAEKKMNIDFRKWQPEYVYI